MYASGWPITLLLFCLIGSATSSPVSIYTPTSPLPSQISPPFPTTLPSLPFRSLSTLPSISPLAGTAGEPTEKHRCPLMVSPSTLVVRNRETDFSGVKEIYTPVETQDVVVVAPKFGDPVTANCSLQRTGFPLLGWEVSLAAPDATTDRFLVWSVDRMTEWSIKPMCYALSEQQGQCHIDLPLIVYKPPENVYIHFVNHTGPMVEGHQYTLQCTVQDVAPVGNLIVTFYRGQTALARLQSNNNTTKKPVTEIFTLNINASKEDDGVQYWCEAELELGPDGPQNPPVVRSQKIPATVLFGPQLVCPTKLKVREGESLSCEVRGNPQPFVTWFRDGQVVALPTHSSRKHAGKYTVLAEGLLGQKNFTVEVEVLAGSGTANSCKRHFFLAVLLIQMNWL